MKFGFALPGGEARIAAEYAAQAEQSGWDGFFVWEPVWGNDAWVSLAAAAMRTERIRLGTLISPLSRMRPWDFAGKSASVDRLSGGRVIISVGLGAVDTGFEAFGEVTDRRTRASLLDEGLEVVTGLWRGQPFRFDGQHYHVRPTTFYPPPPPIQQPRIPIWVVAAWPRDKSMQRALRYDGLLPTLVPADGPARQVGVEDIADIRRYIDAHRAERTPFDIVVEGETPGAKPDQAAAVVEAWAEAGATWWIETLWSAPDRKDGLKAVLRRIRQGPPRASGSST